MPELLERPMRFDSGFLTGHWTLETDVLRSREGHGVIPIMGRIRWIEVIRSAGGKGVNDTVQIELGWPANSASTATADSSELSQLESLLSNPRMW
jgi:hypothetical protein